MKEEIRNILVHETENISKYQKGDKFVVEIMESGYPYSVIGERRNCSEEFLDSLDRLDGDYINEHFGELQDEAYNKGLNDAWELFKKVLEMPNDVICEHILEEDAFNPPLAMVNCLTPQEALAKLKAYEEAQNQIEVGDVVEYRIEKISGICVGVIDAEEECYVWFKEYDCVQRMKEVMLEKTGKHIDISSILEQIGE